MFQKGMFDGKVLTYQTILEGMYKHKVLNQQDIQIVSIYNIVYIYELMVIQNKDQDMIERIFHFQV